MQWVEEQRSLVTRMRVTKHSTALFLWVALKTRNFVRYCYGLGISLIAFFKMHLLVFSEPSGLTPGSLSSLPSAHPHQKLRTAKRNEEEPAPQLRALLQHPALCLLPVLFTGDDVISPPRWPICLPDFAPTSSISEPQTVCSGPGNWTSSALQTQAWAPRTPLAVPIVTHPLFIHCRYIC